MELLILVLVELFLCKFLIIFVFLIIRPSFFIAHLFSLLFVFLSFLLILLSLFLLGQIILLFLFLLPLSVLFFLLISLFLLLLSLLLCRLVVFTSVFRGAILKDTLDPADEVTEVLDFGGGGKLDEIGCFLRDTLFELVFLLLIKLQEHLLDLDHFLV